MFYCPPKYIKPVKDINEELRATQGELTDKQARMWLCKYLRRNLGQTVELLTGIRLAPYQIINIKAMLNRNFSMFVWGRGCSKSYCAAIYCILQCLFESESKIVVAGPTFRTSRLIFNYIEDIMAKKEAKYLIDIMGGKLSKRNDEFRWRVNGGAIVGIPLNGEKIRGIRANILVIDEFLLMSEDLVEKVLLPYTVVPKNIGERMAIRQEETRRIREGKMKENERAVFENKNKMIALSSASYKCEYLYRKYEDYIKRIYNDDDNLDEGTYFLSQLAWDAIPPDMIDKTVIKAAQGNEANTAIFAREYGAQFIDGSDSYFSMNKMIDCTIPDGEKPTLLIKGNKGSKYIIGIDPDHGGSATGDDFAMCLIELDENGETGTVVHSYAKAGRDLKDHIKYFYYLLTNFNIEFICLDHAGGISFIDACNASEIFQKNKLDIKIFEFSAEKDGPDLEEQLKSAKTNYNRTISRIAFTQIFNTESIRKMNEWLQGCIDFKKIWFGSSIKGNSSAFTMATNSNVDLNLLGLEKDGEEDDDMSFNNSNNLSKFIDEQYRLLKQTKYQCASIEVKTTAKGTQSFDLPLMMQRDKSAKRMRKDSYTALLLACWAMRQFSDINKIPEQQFETFTPFFLD